VVAQGKKGPAEGNLAAGRPAGEQDAAPISLFHVEPVTASLAHTRFVVLSSNLCNAIVAFRSKRATLTKGQSRALIPLAATHVHAHQRRTPSHPMPNVLLQKEPPTRKLTVYAPRSDVWTVFWSFVVRVEKVGRRFCGTFCALVDAMLP